MMFIGPWDLGGPWDPSAIEGVSRFLSRAWTVIMAEPRAENLNAAPNADDVRALERKLHQTILKVSDDMANFRFNTAIAAMMELNNLLIKMKETAVVGSPVWDAALNALVRLMAPIFPHISEELWHYIGEAGAPFEQERYSNVKSVHLQRWPQGDTEKAREDEITIVVQINGKVRDKLMISPGTAKGVLEEQALASANIQKHMNGKRVRKVIVVPDKLVNVVIG